MTEPTQLFLTLSATTPDGVIHRRYTVLDMVTLERSNIKEELFAQYLKLKMRFLMEVENEKAETVS
jgi:hypothetical protein